MVTQHSLDHLLHGLDGDDLTLLRGNAIDSDGATMTEGHALGTVAIVMMTCRGASDKPLEFEVVEGLEEVLVVDLDLTVLQALVGDPHVLIVVAHLVGMGIETAIGGDDTVAVEVVVGGGIAAVVATIGEDLFASDLALVAQTLIDEVPDIAALVFRMLADEVPVLLETAHRVTHGVGILALDQRTGIVALGVFLAVLVAIVHRTEDIGLALTTCLFVLHRARGVVGLHPVVALLEVRTVAGFVAQRPHDDRGVILKRHHIALLTLEVGLGIIVATGQCLLAVTHAVALDIGLGRQIEAVLVAEVVPAGIVGIVAGAYGIDIQIFHDLDILDHALYGDNVSAIGIEFMTIGTLDEDRLSVDEQLAALDLDMTEAYALGNHLEHLGALLQGDE